MKKQVQILLLPQDEDALSRALRTAKPSIRFVNDSVWPSKIPPAHDSISECSSPWAFIWDTDLFPELPSRQRLDGRFDGPISGVVFQVCRSRLEGTVLLSGRIAIGLEDTRDDVRQLVKLVFGTLRNFTRPAVWASTGDEAPEYRVAPAASQWRQTEGHVFCDRATGHILV